jgi:hypothetical protein
MTPIPLGSPGLILDALSGASNYALPHRSRISAKFASQAAALILDALSGVQN